MSAATLLLLVHAAATWFLAGLIWVVQLVHYPLFDHVERSRFADFERLHAARITWIVGPAMALELGSGLWLLAVAPAGSARVLLTLGAGLLALLVVCTACVQVPCHRRLEQGFDAAVHRRLVSTNWWRTAAWSARALLVTALLAGALA